MTMYQKLPDDIQKKIFNFFRACKNCGSYDTITLRDHAFRGNKTIWGLNAMDRKVALRVLKLCEEEEEKMEDYFCVECYNFESSYAFCHVHLNHTRAEHRDIIEGRPQPDYSKNATSEDIQYYRYVDYLAFTDITKSQVKYDFCNKKKRAYFTTYPLGSENPRKRPKFNEDMFVRNEEIAEMKEYFNEEIFGEDGEYFG